MSNITRDQYGIIGQVQPGGWVEGGDSACWMGHYVYLTGDKFPYVSTFEVAPGAYVRHPYPHATNNRFGAHYKNPWNGCMSRDQLTGVLAALVGQKERLALLRLVLHQVPRLLIFAYNTVHNGKEPSEYRFNLLKLFYNPKQESYYKIPDLMLFDMWGMILRGFGKLSYLFYPILCVFDIHLLISTLLINKDDKDDQINYAIRMIVANENVPTFVSKLAWKLMDKAHVLARIKSYWCGWRQNCGMYDLYEGRLK